MRVDDYLSTVGVVKRRTVAKELAQNGLVEVNGRPAKPSHQVQVHDIITIKGSTGLTVEVLDIPSGSVAREARERFVRTLPRAK